MANKQPTTRGLVERAQKGDRDAIEALFAKSYPDLVQAVRFRLGEALRHRMDSLDLAQSAYLEAYRDLDGYQYGGKGSFRRWLMGIVENKIRGRLKFFKAQRRDMRREVALEGQSVPPRDTLSPVSRVLALEDRARLEAAMDRLPDEYREVIISRYYLRMSWKAVGERHGQRSPEAVQMLARRALLKLKELYQGT